MKILGIIPARGGSKGIKRKNLRLLHKNPLIYYQIQNALKSKFVDDIVITSDSNEILNYGSNFPAYLRKRPKNLADDVTTLDPVIYDAVEYMESTTGEEYDMVITLQPTSPLLSHKSLDAAIEKFIHKNLDTLLPVTDATHLYWNEKNGIISPDYDNRLNRQWLPKKYKENGAFLITRREYVKINSRFGEKLDIFILDEIEGLDIDTKIDFLIAEVAIKRLRLAFIVNGNKEVGMGHIYRSLTLADGFLGHKIIFLTCESDERSISLIRERGHKVLKIDENLLLNELKQINPDIVINDILDTQSNYVSKLKNCGFFVVNFEDMGNGADEADLVFNALYEKTNPKPNHKFGHEYECLNEKFFLYSPIELRKEPKKLLVTFGGVDQNNITLRVLKCAEKILNETTIENIIVVIGAGYFNKLDINSINSELLSKITIHKNVDNMPALMKEADIAITSNGRTIYELTAMGIPTISIAQNDRETLHLFSRYNHGIKYLGISCTIIEEDIANSIIEISNDYNIRSEMYKKQLESAPVIKNGLTKIIDEIISDYWMWKHEQIT